LEIRRGLPEMLKSYSSDYNPEDDDLQEWEEWFKSDKAGPVEAVDAKHCFMPRPSSTAGHETQPTDNRVGDGSGGETGLSH
jgi:hypothetical protein